MIPAFEKYKCFVFDLDGTIWWWSELCPGAKEVVDTLRDEGKEVYFLTNNSMLSPQGFVERLGKLGIKTEVDKIICPADFIATFLTFNKLIKWGKVFYNPIGAGHGLPCHKPSMAASLICMTCKKEKL